VVVRKKDNVPASSPYEANGFNDLRKLVICISYRLPWSYSAAVLGTLASPELS
jgi:hypothetical protein